MTARNRAAYERSLHKQGLVRQFLEHHPPLAPPVTGRVIAERFGVPVRTARWLLRRVRSS